MNLFVVVKLELGDALEALLEMRLDTKWICARMRTSGGYCFWPVRLSVALVNGVERQQQDGQRYRARYQLHGKCAAIATNQRQ